MKLRQWLKEYRKMTYAEYAALNDTDRQKIWDEFRYFVNKQSIIKSGCTVRPMTEDERAYAKALSEKEHRRYEINLMIGGIDERGNYTALHHRYCNPHTFLI